MENKNKIGLINWIIGILIGIAGIIFIKLIELSGGLCKC